MKTKIKLYSVILFLIPILIFFIFNYFDIPKKIFLDTILFFDHLKMLSFLFFILFYTIAILLFLPLGVFFHIISGLIYSPLFAYLLSLSAILIATTISFYISQKNFSFFNNKKKKYHFFFKKFEFSNNEILNIFLLRLAFFIPISVQNILSIFITKNVSKLLLVTIITTSPPMIAIIISANKIKDDLMFDQFQSFELIKIYMIIFFSLIFIHLMRLFINSLINKSKKKTKFNT